MKWPVVYRSSVFNSTVYNYYPYSSTSKLLAPLNKFSLRFWHLLKFFNLLNKNTPYSRPATTCSEKPTEGEANSFCLWKSQAWAVLAWLLQRCIKTHTHRCTLIFSQSASHSLDKFTPKYRRPTFRSHEPCSVQHLSDLKFMRLHRERKEKKKKHASGLISWSVHPGI